MQEVGANNPASDVVKLTAPAGVDFVPVPVSVTVAVHVVAADPTFTGDGWQDSAVLVASGDTLYLMTTDEVTFAAASVTDPPGARDDPPPPPPPVVGLG